MIATGSTTSPQPWPYAKLIYGIVVLCWVAYVILSLSAPEAANAKYQLSPLALVLLRVTIFIPVHLIWLLAAYGAITFKSYAGLIKGSPEAEGISNIGSGLLWTVGYLIFLTIGGTILPFFAGSQVQPSLVIMRDHLTAIVSLIAFFYMYRGSSQLRAIAKFATWTRVTFLVLAGFAVFSYGFVLEFATNPTTIINPGTTPTSINFVAQDLLVVTLVLPYIISWFLGALAGVNIAKYAARVKGIVYRQALQNLVKGIWAVVFFAMSYQILAFASRYLVNINFTLTLVLIYGLLVLYGLGFIFIRIGARKLTQIETAQ